MLGWKVIIVIMRDSLYSASRAQTQVAVACNQWRGHYNKVAFIYFTAQIINLNIFILYKELYENMIKYTWAS